MRGTTHTSGTRTHCNPGSYNHPGLRRTISEQIALFRLPAFQTPSRDVSFPPLLVGWLVALSLGTERRSSEQQPQPSTPGSRLCWSCHQSRGKDCQTTQRERERPSKNKAGEAYGGLANCLNMGRFVSEMMSEERQCSRGLRCHSLHTTKGC